MYKCLDCDYIFEEPIEWEESHGFSYGLFEKMKGCPFCKGSFEKVFECQECGEHFFEEELYAGLCEKCISDLIDYKIATKVIEDCESYADFFLGFFFKTTKKAVDTNAEFEKELKKLFERKRLEDEENNSTAFFDMVKAYVLEDLSIVAEIIKERREAKQ